MKTRVSVVVILCSLATLLNGEASAASVEIPCGDEAALIVAVQNANGGMGPTTLELAPDPCAEPYSFTTSFGSDNALEATDKLKIIGNNRVFQRDPAAVEDFRILEIGFEAKVTLMDLVIQDGRAPENRSGGGIENFGKLTLKNVSINNNVAGGSTASIIPGACGGGIYNAGKLSAKNVTIEGNVAGAGAPSVPDFSGRGGNGGGICNVPAASMSFKGRILSNSAGPGGTGGVLPGGDGGDGGGIYNFGKASIKVEEDAIADNSAGSGGTGTPAGFDGLGGGIYNDYEDALKVKAGSVQNNTPDNCKPEGSVKGCENN